MIRETQSITERFQVWFYRTWSRSAEPHDLDKALVIAAHGLLALFIAWFIEVIR